MKTTRKSKSGLCALAGLTTLLIVCPSSHAQDRRSSSVDNEMLLSDDLVVTTASKTSLHVSDVPASVTVITAEQIRDSGATNIPDLLRSVPGIDVVAANESQINVSIRGFNRPFANSILVMIDGRSIYQDLFGGVFWQSEPLLLARIKRIEIVRGPGSALYGANAFNGVINIITKTPEEMAQEAQSFQANLKAGERKSVFAEALYHSSPAKDWNLVLGAGLHQTDGQGDRRPGHVQDGYQAPIFSLDAQKQMPRGSLRLSLDEANSKADLTSAYVTTLNEHWLSQDAILTYEEQNVSNPILARFFVNSFLSPGSDNEDLKTYDLEVQQQRRLSARQNLVYGGNYRYVSVKFSEIGAMTHRQTLWSAYAQDDIQLGAQTHLFAGLRQDNNSQYGSTLSPRLSLVHHLSDVQTVRLSYGTAFHAPTALASYLDVTTPLGPLGVLHTIGNPNLKPEQITSLEAGYHVDLRGGSVGLSVFSNRLSQLIAFLFLPPTAPGGPFTNAEANTGNARANGLEFESAFTVNPRLHGLFNYSYQDVVNSDGSQVAESPRNKVNLTLDAQLSSRLSATCIGHYVDRSLDLPQQGETIAPVIRPYMRIDGRIAYRLGTPQHPSTLSISVTNLFDDKHFEQSDALAPGQQPSVAPQRRTLWLGVETGF